MWSVQGDPRLRPLVRRDKCSLFDELITDLKLDIYSLREAMYVFFLFVDIGERNDLAERRCQIEAV